MNFEKKNSKNNKKKMKVSRIGTDFFFRGRERWRKYRQVLSQSHKSCLEFSLAL